MKVENNKLYERVELFCSSPGSLNQHENKELLRELLRSYYYEESFLERNKLEQMLGMVRRSSETEISAYVHILHAIAFAEYDNGDLNFSEFLFRFACDLVDDISMQNNLAYILRRKDNESINNGEVITLLLPGIIENDPFCIINMGLLFSLNLSSSEDWHTADDLFSLLPIDLKGADSWWENVGNNGDMEGFLVHFFLLRHNKIKNSSLGSTINGIVALLKRKINGFPEWLYKNYPISSILDVIECMDDPGYENLLDDYLTKLPRTRESVDELLDVLSVASIFEIYYKLLKEWHTLLKPEEYAKLKAEFEKKYSIELQEEI